MVFFCFIWTSRSENSVCIIMQESALGSFVTFLTGTRQTHSFTRDENQAWPQEHCATRGVACYSWSPGTTWQPARSLKQKYGITHAWQKRKDRYKSSGVEQLFLRRGKKLEKGHCALKVRLLKSVYSNAHLLSLRRTFTPVECEQYRPCLAKNKKEPRNECKKTPS